MTAHAQLRGWNSGTWRYLGCTMAVQALNAVIADMMAMVELDRLIDNAILGI